MRAADLRLTIVRHASQLSAYPHERLDNALRIAIADALISNKIVDPSRFSLPGLLKLLECFLAVTNRDLSLSDIQSPRAANILCGFLGALGDEHFYAVSKVTAKNSQRVFRLALRALQSKFTRIEIPSSQLEQCSSTWAKFELTTAEVEYWSGWWVRGLTGREAFFNLAPIWRKYGAEIARKTHGALLTYWQRLETTSTQNSKPLFVEFFEFLESTGGYDSAFHDGEALSMAIFGFCEHFFTRAYEDGLDIDISVKRWNDWRIVVNAALIEQKVWPRPNPPIPAPPRRDVPGGKTHIRKSPDGVEIREKLLTDIPLNLLDDQVIEILFREVSDDRDAIVSWANEQANRLLERCRQRKELASRGAAYQGGHSKHTLAEIGRENLCAAFELVGMEMFQPSRSLSMTGLCKAEELEELLGLPGAYELEPYMYLLINEHPKITDSFLKSLTVYDKHGHFVGFDKNDTGYTLVGQKKRRGSRLAEQRIELNPAAQRCVQEVLEITEPLRTWLRATGQDDWRYLFLTTSRGLPKPGQVIGRRYATHGYEQSLVDQLRPHSAKSDEQLFKLVGRLTLTTFRASRGVCVYLETKDVEAMARELGHAKYRPGLLEHYLPDPILRFFRSRWMRVFQTALICEALADSEHLLRAADFESMEQLHEFLRNHAFSRIPSHLERRDHNVKIADQAEDDRVYVNAGVGVLTLLVSLEMAVSKSDRPVNGKARYWADFARVLLAEMDRGTHDAILSNNLALARKNASPGLFVEYVCA